MLGPQNSRWSPLPAWLRGPRPYCRDAMQTRGKAGSKESLRLQAIERDVDGPASHVASGVAHDLVANRDGVCGIAKPQVREQHDLFKFSEYRNIGGTHGLEC